MKARLDFLSGCVVTATGLILNPLVTTAALLLATHPAFSAPEVVAWGDSSYGQTTVPAGLSNVVAVAAGEDHSLALVGLITARLPVILTDDGHLGFTNGCFGFNVQAHAGQAVVVEASADLVHWSPVHTNLVQCL